MGIRNRIVEFIGGKELRQEQERIRASIDYLVDAWQYQADPTTVIEQLKEYDSAALVDLVHDLEYERIGGMQYSIANEGRRERQVQDSVRMWLNSPLSVWTINVWTSYGMGEGVKIVLDDEDVQDVWEETVARSGVLQSDVLHELSNWVLIYGNDFLVQFISTLDGSSTWEMIPAEEIVDVVKTPGSNRVLFYKRLFTDSKGIGHTWYYPNADEYLGGDWGGDDESLLPPGAIRTDAEQENRTIALMCHIAHNKKDPKQCWGWPILGVTAPYMRAHKEFVENRLTVSRNKASYVREFTTKGGSRAVNAVKAKLNSTLSATNAFETNPGAVAGSDLIHNEALSMKDLQMGTGANDAKQDNEMFAWLALIGAGLFPTSAGLDTSRWATALAMDKTQSTQWSRYQSFWSNNFRRLVKLTLQAAERWGSIKAKEYGATVSIDTLSLVDFPGIVGPISQLIGSMQPFVDNGVIPSDAAKKVIQSLWLIVLQSLGVNDADIITSDESFGIGLPDEVQELWIDIRRELNKISEYNPNHDSKGRFSSSSSSGGILGMSSEDYERLMTSEDLPGVVNEVIGSTLSPAQQEEFFRQWKEKRGIGTKQESVSKGSSVNALSSEKIDSIVSGLPDATGNQTWAVRFTNDPNRDVKQPVSFVDWGIAPYKSKSAASKDYPDRDIVYDKNAGGYLPALSGLSSFSDSSASSAMSRANRWSGGGSAYKYVVVYKGRHVGFGPDGEDLTVPGKEIYIFNNGS